jgi:S-disulfanyl-L-cysteine oxidoreductase SoxD
MRWYGLVWIGWLKRYNQFEIVLRIFHEELAIQVLVNRIVILCGGVFAVGLLYCGLQVDTARVHAAQDQPSAALYSTAQAKRGADLYQAQQCGVCHGADLGGVGPSPPLSGDNFLSIYTGQKALVLFDKVQKTMPQSSPGSLTPAQTADLLAYMLSVSKYAAGDEELSADREKLKTILIPKPAK